MLTAESLVLELDLSHWMMWAVEEMRQTSLIVLTEELVITTVVMMKMQERSVHSKVVEW